MPSVIKTAKCNSWSEWINRFSSVNRSGSEYVTKDELEIICPSSANGFISGMKCRDDKGEPFKPSSNFSLSGDKAFKFRCGDLTGGNKGAECFPVFGNGSCPDYEIQFECSCM